MAITLPLPVRVAAGLLATGIQVVRSLPEEIPAIPVAIVGNAMRLSMKVQQEITTLATRGDELLGGIIGGRPQENPSWATFDEERPAPAPPRRSATAPRSAPVGRTSVPVTEDSAAATTVRTTAAAPSPASATVDAPAPGHAVAEPLAPENISHQSTESGLHAPEATAMSDTVTTATEAAAEVSEALIAAATEAVPPASSDAPGTDVIEEADDGPTALPGYDRMTLAQVRVHIRDLPADAVSALLAYEQSGDNRAPFLTLLTNRLVTLGAADS